MLGWILIIISNRFYVFIIPFIIIALLLFYKKNYRSLLFLIIGLVIGLISLINFFKYPTEINDGIGVIYTRKENYFLLFLNGNRYYVYSENHSYEIGDIILVNGDVSNIKSYSLEGQFDFNNYLYNLNVERCIENYNLKTIFKNPLRINQIIDDYLSNYDTNVRDFLGVIFFNRSNHETTSSLYNLKIGHLFTMSGIQVYSLFYLIRRILLFFNNNEKFISKITFIFLIPLLVLSSFKLSFIKALMVILVRDILNKKDLKERLNIVFLMVILLFNNRFVFTSSFFYIFLMPYVLKFCYKALNGYKEKTKKFLQLFIINQLCNIYEIFTEGEWNLFGLIYYPIGYIFSGAIVFLGTISLLIPIYSIMSFIVNIFLNLINVLNDLNIIISLVEHNMILLIVQVVLFIICMYLIELKLNTSATTIFLVNMFVISLNASSLQRYTSEYISFINVGQGDCAHIHRKDLDILIDTGGSKYEDIGLNVLYPYFKKRSIKQLDAVFISHNDFDHNGSLSTLYKLININQVIEGSTFYEIKIGDLVFKNLNIFNMGTEENDNSSIITFKMLNKYFLFMGDASNEIENKLINYYKNIPCDIIKIGHHGSSTSTSMEFLKFIKPEEAIISVGRNNYYGHPNKEVIYNLKSLNIKIRRTDIEGTIQYKQNYIPF